MADREYVKLTGRSWMSVQRCYLAEDHLLILDGAYRERIKRIRLTDIEAVLICPTKSGNVISLISGLSGFLLLIAALVNTGSAMFWVWLSFALIAWVFFARGIFGKGSALMGLQTAVQTVHLEGVATLRQARKVGERLHQAITAAQGPILAEEIAAYKAQAAEARRSRSVQVPPLARAGPVSPPELSV